MLPLRCPLRVGLPVLGHMLKHVPRHVLKHVSRHMLKYVPRQVLEHVHKYVPDKHMLDRHVLGHVLGRRKQNFREHFFTIKF